MKTWSNPNCKITVYDMLSDFKQYSPDSYFPYTKLDIASNNSLLLLITPFLSLMQCFRFLIFMMFTYFYSCMNTWLFQWPVYAVLRKQHYDDVKIDAMASQITSLTIVYSTIYSGADQRKHQTSPSLAFVRGIRRGPVNSPHKCPVTRKMFPFDDVIMKICETSTIFCMCVYCDMYISIVSFG